MIRYIYIYVLLSICQWSFCQVNLINNYSFEAYSNCPFNFGSINLAQGWSQTSQSTSEYLNACAQYTDAVSVPTNAGGHQYAQSGNAYAGLFIYSYPNSNDTNTIGSEYIQTILTHSLQANSCYYFEMYYSVADISGFGTNRLQAYLSTTQFTATSGQAFNNIQAQVEVDSTTFVTDTLNWTKVSGYFTANGGEKYLTIGNFKDKTHTKKVKLNPSYIPPWTYSDSNFCYVYIDDVSLYACTDVGIQNLENDYTVSLYPNPANTEVYISAKGYEQLSLSVYNIMGELVMQQPVKHRQSIDVKMLNPGTYMYRLFNGPTEVKNGKLMISK